MLALLLCTSACLQIMRGEYGKEVGNAAEQLTAHMDKLISGCFRGFEQSYNKLERTIRDSMDWRKNGAAFASGRQRRRQTTLQLMRGGSSSSSDEEFEDALHSHEDEEEEEEQQQRQQQQGRRPAKRARMGPAAAAAAAAAQPAALG